MMLTISWTHYNEKKKKTSCVKYINQNLQLIYIPSKTVIAAYFQYGLTMINSKPKKLSLSNTISSL